MNNFSIVDGDESNQPLGSGAVAFELALDLGGMVGDVAAGDRWDMMVGVEVLYMHG